MEIIEKIRIFTDDYYCIYQYVMLKIMLYEPFMLNVVYNIGLDI